MKSGVPGPLEVRADHGLQAQAILGQGAAFQPEAPRRPEAASPAPAKPAAPDAWEPTSDVRKTVTILFADLVRFLAARASPSIPKRFGTCSRVTSAS